MNKFLLILIMISTSLILWSQNVGIGTNTPDPSAKLHIVDPNRGVLINSVVLNDVTVAAPITAPATGLLVWNTNAAVTGGSGVGYYYWDGAEWVRILNSDDVSDDWRLLGNAGTNQNINFIGTTDGQDFVTKTNNAERVRVKGNTGYVGIGTNAPSDRLTVSNGRVEFTNQNDASGVQGSGVLEIGNTLRLDGNEIITNNGSPLYLQNDNFGNLTVDNGTFHVNSTINNIGVGTTNPQLSASLHLAQNNRGILINQVALTNAFTYAPVIGTVQQRGLLVWNTNFWCNGCSGVGFYYWTGTKWVRLLNRDDNVNDADANPTNELQTISRTGTTVTLSNGGGTFQDSVGVYTAGTGIDITNNVVSTTEPTYTIGLWPELGGYVFWVSADGKHGLVAETQDQSTNASWYVAQNQISNPANHSIDGRRFRDWRMPTRYELNEMYVQRAAIGGFTNNVYWNSTEITSVNAWAQLFGSGQQGNVPKSTNYYVRAVRAF